MSPSSIAILTQQLACTFCAITTPVALGGPINISFSGPITDIVEYDVNGGIPGSATQKESSTFLSRGDFVEGLLSFSLTEFKQPGEWSLGATADNIGLGECGSLNLGKEFFWQPEWFYRGIGQNHFGFDVLEFVTADGVTIGGVNTNHVGRFRIVFAGEPGTLLNSEGQLLGTSAAFLRENIDLAIVSMSLPSNLTEEIFATQIDFAITPSPATVVLFGLPATAIAGRRRRQAHSTN